MKNELAKHSFFVYVLFWKNLDIYLANVEVNTFWPWLNPEKYTECLNDLKYINLKDRSSIFNNNCFKKSVTCSPWQIALLSRKLPPDNCLSEISPVALKTTEKILPLKLPLDNILPRKLPTETYSPTTAPRKLPPSPPSPNRQRPWKITLKRFIIHGNCFPNN